MRDLSVGTVEDKMIMGKVSQFLHGLSDECAEPDKLLAFYEKVYKILADKLKPDVLRDVMKSFEKYGITFKENEQFNK